MEDPWTPPKLQRASSSNRAWARTSAIGRLTTATRMRWPRCHSQDSNTNRTQAHIRCPGTSGSGCSMRLSLRAVEAGTGDRGHPPIRRHIFETHEPIGERRVRGRQQRRTGRDPASPRPARAARCHSQAVCVRPVADRRAARPTRSRLRRLPKARSADDRLRCWPGRRETMIRGRDTSAAS